MATSRSFGGTLLTTRSPMRISPPVMFSSPAIMRSKVDLPQPDGPTSTTNSPSPMSTLTPWITSTAPKALRTSLMATGANVFLLPVLVLVGGRYRAPDPLIISHLPPGASPPFGGAARHPHCLQCADLDNCGSRLDE